MPERAASTAGETPHRAGYAWFVVAVLSLLQIGSYIDRQVINLLVEPMRRDFGITDTQVSLLLGFAFAAFYAVMAVPIGRLADTYSRVALIVGCVLFWSGATLWCMFADGYWSLFFARMLVGLGEAGLAPAAFSILGDYFRPGRLARATSCLTGASFVGSGLALALGGIVIGRLPAEAFVSLPLVGEVRTWQLAFGFASLPSLAVLMLFFLVREPARRGGGPATDRASMAEIIRYLRSDASLWLAVFAGMSFCNAFQYGLTAWIPTFFVRTYGWAPSEIGQYYGACFLICGTLGTLTGGLLCDYLFDRFGRAAFLMMPLISASICLPLVIAFALSGNGTASAALLVPLTFVATMAFGATIASIPSLAPNRMRAQLVAAYMLLGTIVGQGGGPWLIAVFTDYAARDPALIRYSIAVVSPVLLAFAATILWNGIRAVARTAPAASAAQT